MFTGILDCVFVTDGRAALPALAASLFTLGFAGGFSHCTFMCGPFVTAQAAARLTQAPPTELARLRGMMMLPYHLGRATTYSLLGGLAALLAGQTHSFMPQLAALFILLAGVGMMLSALGKGKNLVPLPAPVLNRVATIAAPLMENPTGSRGYTLGVVLGFLPCGMLYAALAAAAASGEFWKGLLAMGAFAAGTVPALVAVALGTSLFARKFSGPHGRKIVSLIFFMVGAWLGLAGLRNLL